MVTNLIFKKQENIDGVTKTITKIVKVDVPFIESGEGWILSGHTDELLVQCDIPYNLLDKVAPIENESPKLPEKFNSDVSGTAKLVRSKGVIKIVARKGKSTYNQTTPNSICIHDSDKIEFFSQCRRFHGATSGLYEFSISDGKPYEAWNAFIDNEYKRQQLRAK